jgi:hypothetical protein
VYHKKWTKNPLKTQYIVILGGFLMGFKIGEFLTLKSNPLPRLNAVRKT